MIRLTVLFVSIGLIFNLSITDVKVKGGEKMAIQNGRKVPLEYTLTVDGEVVDSSEKHGPLQYTHGEGQIISGLADRLEGLQEGAEKTIEVSPEQAYGKMNPEAFKEFPKSSLPQDLEPKVGMLLQVQRQNGQAVPAKISEVKEDSIILDLNHPLAGKTLTFDVKILSVEE